MRGFGRLLTRCACLLAGAVAPVGCAGPVRPEITGRAVVGYQGWFRAEGDGSGLGFRHYDQRGRFEPGQCSVDCWPDVSELGPGARHATAFRKGDGSAAEVFSSADPETVRLHFGWMRDYGIGGAMLQRFAVSTRDERLRASLDVVLGNVRAASHETGVPWALMYDLSGCSAGEVPGRVLDDLDALVAAGDFRQDAGYLRLRGRPLVAVWGVGFNDGRAYTVASCLELVRALHERGWSVFVGVPYWWLDGTRDAVDDPALRQIAGEADMVSPWSVGRYASPGEAARGVEARVRGDLAWLRERGVGYAPVVFPGFSWHNMHDRDARSPLGQIPRAGGRFLWVQASAAVACGADTVYLAMFDEMDEGTCLFKVDPDPPVGGSPFLTYEGLARDHYLWLSGRVEALLRGEIDGGAMPTR